MRRGGQLVDSGVTALAPAIRGSTYLVTTELLPPGRPLLAAVVRALPAGLVLLGVGRVLPTGAWLWRALVLGTLNIGAFFSFLFVAAYRLPGGLPGPTVAGFLYLVVLGSLAGYSVWFRGIERLPALAVSFLAFASPVVATLLGYVFLGQVLTIAQVAGALVILGAVVLAQPRPVAAAGGRDGPAAAPRAAFSHQLVSAHRRGRK